MDLLGKEVVEQNGSLVGMVNNVMFDEKIWQVGSLKVQLDEKMAAEFDAKKLFKNYLVDLDVIHVQGVGDRITLNKSKEELMIQLAKSEALPPTN